MLTKPEIHEVMDEVVKKQTKSTGRGFANNIANPFATNRNYSNNNNNSNEMSAMGGAPQPSEQQVVVGYPQQQQQQQRSGQDQRPTGASQDIDAV
jgi:ABC-type taurine transport system substrate-binding protein